MGAAQTSNSSRTRRRRCLSCLLVPRPAHLQLLRVMELGVNDDGDPYGVCSKVWLVEGDNGKRFAGKFMLKKKVLGTRMQRFTFTEKRILSQLQHAQHPYIVKLYQALQTQSELVLLLEYCPGGNLQALIDRHGRQPTSVVRHFSAEVLLALEFLHDRRYLHRDVKPANVLRDAEGHAVLADFGFAKKLALGELTASNVGSAVYKAPEFFHDEADMPYGWVRPYGSAVDIYAFGMLVYHLSSGRRPFEYASNLSQVQHAAMHGQLDIYLLPPSVKELVSATTAKEPARRLGYSRTSDIREVSLFATMNWDALDRREVPAPHTAPLIGDVSFQAQPELVCRQLAGDGFVSTWDWSP